MPQKLDEVHDAIVRRLKGKVNPRTKKPYTEDDFWAIAQAQYKKMKKEFTVFTPITKSWEDKIETEKGVLPQRFIEVTVSGLKEDRDGERISQEAISDMIVQYKSGTIPLFPNHGRNSITGQRDYRWQDIMGVWVDAKQEGDKLIAVARLNKSHPEGDLFFNYLKEGMPIGFSIGGKPMKVSEEIIEETEVILEKKAMKYSEDEMMEADESRMEGMMEEMDLDDNQKNKIRGKRDGKKKESMGKN